jgi:hypothetical protein
LKTKASSNLDSPSYEVFPVGHYLSEYKDKHRIIVRDIESRPIPLPERLELYEQEMKKLKNQFRKVRQAEYESKSIEVSKGHSCTSKKPGGKKNCGWKCALAPTSDLYTRKEWVRTTGTNKGLQVSASQACIKMTVSGRGTNKGTVYATFRYRPDVITKRVERDVFDLFNLIAANKDVDFSDYVDERQDETLSFNESLDVE